MKRANEVKESKTTPKTTKQNSRQPNAPLTPPAGAGCSRAPRTLTRRGDHRSGFLGVLLVCTARICYSMNVNSVLLFVIHIFPQELPLWHFDFSIHHYYFVKNNFPFNFQFLTFYREPQNVEVVGLLIRQAGLLTPPGRGSLETLWHLRVTQFPSLWDSWVDRPGWTRTLGDYLQGFLGVFSRLYFGGDWGSNLSGYLLGCSLMTHLTQLGEAAYARRTE